MTVCSPYPPAKIESQTYERIYNPETGVSPNSKRFFEDIGGVYAPFDIVSETKGVYVHGLAQTTGRRFKRAKNKGKRGGKRMAGDPSIRYLVDVKKMHPGLFTMTKEAMEVTQSGSGSES